MKTVTIPTCANPFVVIVNGIKYTYPAGATVEVPDDVAAVIEQHDEAHNNPEPAPVQPPFASAPSSGGSGTGGGGGASGGGGLPVVEITSVIRQVDGGEMYTTELTEAENAALSAVVTSKTPIIINMQIVALGDATIECSALFNRCDTGSLAFYTAVIFLLEKSISMAIACDEGVWMVMGMEMSNG